MERPSELRWSYSILRELQRCPAAAALHINGEPAVVSDAIITGSETHHAIARYAKHCLTQKRVRDVDAARQIALSLSDDRARYLMEAFAKAATFPKDFLSFLIEQEFQRETPYGLFRGVVDLMLEVGGTSPFGEEKKQVIIWDWKTGRYVDDEAKSQLATYIWLAGYREGTAYIGLIENNYWTVKEFYFDGIDIDNKERWIMAQIERWAEADEWEERPGTHCAYCLYVYGCPLRESQTLQRLQMSAQGAFGLWQWHEAQAKAMRAIVQEHAKQQGPLHFGEDGVWGYMPVYRRQLTVSWDVVVQRAQQQGVEVPIDIESAVKRGLIQEHELLLTEYSKRFGRLKGGE